MTQASLQPKDAILNTSVPNKCFKIHKAKGNKMQQGRDRFATMVRDCVASQQPTAVRGQDTGRNGASPRLSHPRSANTSTSRQEQRFTKNTSE